MRKGKICVIYGGKKQHDWLPVRRHSEVHLNNHGGECLADNRILLHRGADNAPIEDIKSDLPHYKYILYPRNCPQAHKLSLLSNTSGTLYDGRYQALKGRFNHFCQEQEMDFAQPLIGLIALWTAMLGDFDEIWLTDMDLHVNDSLDEKLKAHGMRQHAAFFKFIRNNDGRIWFSKSFQEAVDKWIEYGGDDGHSRKD